MCPPLAHLGRQGRQPAGPVTGVNPRRDPNSRIGDHQPRRPVLRMVRPRRLPSGMAQSDPIRTPLGLGACVRRDRGTNGVHFPQNLLCAQQARQLRSSNVRSTSRTPHHRFRNCDNGNWFCHSSICWDRVGVVRGSASRPGRPELHSRPYAARRRVARVDDSLSRTCCYRRAGRNR